MRTLGCSLVIQIIQERYLVELVNLTPKPRSPLPERIGCNFFSTSWVCFAGCAFSEAFFSFGPLPIFFSPN